MNRYERCVLIAGMAMLLSVAVSAQTYVSQTSGNDSAGTGTPAQPYRSITKALAVLSETGGAISVEAGTYNAILSGDAAALHVNSAKTFSIVGRSAGVNTTVQIENGVWLDNAGAVLSMGLTGTANFNLGSSASALKLTAGQMNILTGTATTGVTLGAGATLIITNGALNARPAAGTNISVLCNGGDVDLSTLPADMATGAITFAGGSNQTIAIPAGGVTIGSISIDKQSRSNTVALKGGDLVCTGMVTFINGLVLTESGNALVVTNDPFGAGSGFVRHIPAGGASHVVGNVKQNLKFSPSIANARNEFPVGDMADYRPAALTFQTAGPGAGGNYGINATVRHINEKPAGSAGLPIANGIAAGADIVRYPSFYWTIKTDSALGATPFNVALTAAGDNPGEINLTEVGANQVKLLRRSGSSNDVGNAWQLQGTRDSYDNLVVNGIPTVTAVNAVGGLSTSGALFTYGLKTAVEPPIFSQILNAGGAAYIRALNSPPLFGGAIGHVTYAASSSDTGVAASLVRGDTLIVTPVAPGTATITVTGTDDQGQTSTRFAVTVNAAGVSVSGRVVYDNAAANGIGGATVTLTPASAGALTATADAAGNFTILNVPPGTYTVSAAKTGNWAGANATDALQAVRAFAGLHLLDELAAAAGDVNSSSSVNATDALLIAHRYAGVITSFAKGDWTFESKPLTVGGSNVTLQTIKGLAVGDINKSDEPAGSNF